MGFGLIPICEWIPKCLPVWESLPTVFPSTSSGSMDNRSGLLFSAWSDTNGQWICNQTFHAGLKPKSVYSTPWSVPYSSTCSRSSQLHGSYWLSWARKYSSLNVHSLPRQRSAWSMELLLQQQRQNLHLLLRDNLQATATQQWSLVMDGFRITSQKLLQRIRMISMFCQSRKPIRLQMVHLQIWKDFLLDGWSAWTKSSKPWFWLRPIQE